MKIKKLSRDKYEKVRHLFHESYPNLAFVYGIIENILPGQIWVNNENDPTACLVMTEMSYCFISGKLDEEIFQQFVVLLKEKELVQLACAENNFVNNVELTSFGFNSLPRRQYQYKKSSGSIPHFKNDQGFLIKEVKEETTLDLCIWKSLLISMYGTTSNYLKNGICFILWDPQKKLVVSEAHGVVSKNIIEIGSITREEYRNRGLSTFIVNHLINYSIEKLLHPTWTCDELNVASWKVAEKQAMDVMTKYVFHTLNKN